MSTRDVSAENGNQSERRPQQPSSLSTSVQVFLRRIQQLRRLYTIRNQGRKKQFRMKVRGSSVNKSS